MIRGKLLITFYYWTPPALLHTHSPIRATPLNLWLQIGSGTRMKGERLRFVLGKALTRKAQFLIDTYTFFVSRVFARTKLILGIQRSKD